jgi:hypothetical protein
MEANKILMEMHTNLWDGFKPALIEALKSDPLYKEVQKSGMGLHYSIQDDLLLAHNTNGSSPIYIPGGQFKRGISLREFILKTVHEGLGHFSYNKCYRYAVHYFWWPQFRLDMQDYCKSCDSCQINKEPTTLPLGNPSSLPQPSATWQSYAIDFAGPFPTSQGYNTLLVILDRFSSFTFLIPVTKNITAIETYQAFHKTIIDEHGPPLSIVVDQDPRFTSHFW